MMAALSRKTSVTYWLLDEELLPTTNIQMWPIYKTLGKIQEQLKLPEHRLIQDVSTT